MPQRDTGNISDRPPSPPTRGGDGTIRDFIKHEADRYDSQHPIKLGPYTNDAIRATENGEIREEDAILAMILAANRNDKLKRQAVSPHQQDTHPDKPPEAASTSDKGSAPSVSEKDAQTDNTINGILENLDSSKISNIHKNVCDYINHKPKHVTEKVLSDARFIRDNFKILREQTYYYHHVRDRYNPISAAEAYANLKERYENGEITDTAKTWFKRAGFDYAQDNQPGPSSRPS